MTVDIWERFGGQGERATSYRNEDYQIWLEKCEGAPSPPYSFQMFLEFFKKKLIFDNFVKVRQYSRDDVVDKQVAELPSDGGKASLEAWHWIEGTCGG